MKKFLGLSLFLVVLGVVGRMDYQEQKFDEENTREVMARLRSQPSPQLEAYCLVAGPVAQHCSDNARPLIRR